MKLRIISGNLKGRYVTVGDNDGIDIRPTQGRVRESVAEILKRRARGAAVADLCAGSGAFGFEMASRGAASVDFVESDKRAAVKIRENAEALGVANIARVVMDDVRKFVEGRAGKITGDDGRKDGRRNDGKDNRRYDIIYYDPPYDSVELQELVPQLLLLLNDGGLLVYERRRLRSEKKAADTGGKANLIDARIYADTVIEIYGGNSGGDDADSALPGDV